MCGYFPCIQYWLNTPPNPCFDASDFNVEARKLYERAKKYIPIWVKRGKMPKRFDGLGIPIYEDVKKEQ